MKKLLPGVGKDDTIAKMPIATNFVCFFHTTWSTDLPQQIVNSKFVHLWERVYYPRNENENYGSVTYSISYVVEQEDSMVIVSQNMQLGSRTRA